MAKTPRRVVYAQLPNASATQYTVPALTKSVLRRMHLSNPTGGAVTVTCGIGVDAAGTRYLDAYSIAAGGVLDLYPGLTLEAAETWRMHASAAASIMCHVDADEYTLG